MLTNPAVEWISCPYCHANDPKPWVVENGYTAVQCRGCRLVYVNPRPVSSLIADGVETGQHNDVVGGKVVIGSRVARKVWSFLRVLRRMYRDVWNADRAISWLDIGAGFGEVVEAVQSIAPRGSRVQGIEPMRPKAQHAQTHRLDVQCGYLDAVKEKYQFASLINVFSHIPDFRPMLLQIKERLEPRGEFFFVTGNIADLNSSRDVPTELDLPDHLVFAGEHHLRGYLDEAGFECLQIERTRPDTIINLAKQLVHKTRGKNVSIVIPYTSGCRSLRIRARLKN